MVRKPWPGGFNALRVERGKQLSDARTHDSLDLRPWNREPNDCGVRGVGQDEARRIEHGNFPIN